MKKETLVKTALAAVITFGIAGLYFFKPNEATGYLIGAVSILACLAFVGAVVYGIIDVTHAFFKVSKKTAR